MHERIIAPILQRVERENKTSRRAPVETELIENLRLLDTIESEDPGGLFESMALIAARSYWFYLRVILNYRWMDPWFHGEEVYRFLQYLDEEEKDGLILMPRGAGKSGMITQPMPAWKLAQNPSGRILLANAEENRAGNMARTNASIITNNWMYNQCYSDIQKGSKWGDRGYFLKGYDDRIDPNLASYGILSNVTGAHINLLMILDDLINAKTAKSPELVRRAEDFFKEMVNLIDPGTPLRICATRWTYNDYCGKIETGELQGRRGKIEVLKLGATRKRTNAQGKSELCLLFPKRTWEDDNGNEYEVGFTWENLDQFKAQLKGLYYALYMNEPVLDDASPFDLNLIRRVSGLHELGFDLGPVHRVVVEMEAGAKALASTFRLMQQKEPHRRVPIEEVTTDQREKIGRIKSAFEHFINSANFTITESDWQGTGGLGEEIKSFPKGTDDCLDAHTHCIENSRDFKEDEIPMPTIAVDPAFTDEDYSDYTAIAVGVKYNGAYYALDTVRFQTNRAEMIVRMTFNIFDKYDKKALDKSGKSKRKKGLSGFSSSQAKNRRGNGRIRRGEVYRDTHTFDIDVSKLVKPKPGD